MTDRRTGRRANTRDGGSTGRRRAGSPASKSSASAARTRAAADRPGARAPFWRAPSFWIALGLVVLTTFAYAGVRHHAFVGFDDPAYVEHNPHIAGGLTWSGVTWAFTTGYATNYHPLTWISHMLDVQFFGQSAGAHHVVNLLFHLANSVLVFVVLRRLTGALWPSAFVAALFALHPLHVESVAWVSERKDVLSTFFWLLTMWAYAAHVNRPGLLRYAALLLALALGLLAKPMLVTLPFVLLLIDVWPLGRLATRTPTQLVVEKIPLFLLAAASGVATMIAQSRGGAVATLHVLPFGLRVLNALVGYLRYLFHAIWPVHLVAFYPYARTMPAWQGIAAGLTLAAATVVILRASRRWPYLGVGWLWFLVTLLPVIGVVQVGMQAIADRYTYVPLLGIFIMVAWGARDLTARWSSRRIVLAVAAAAAIVACTVLTRAQVATWRDTSTLWTHAIDVMPDNARAHSALGERLAEQGQAHEAIDHLREAARLEPDFPDTHVNLGLALASLGRVDDAIEEYRLALRLNPNMAEAYNDLGNALLRIGRIDEAIAAYRSAARLAPDLAEARENLGLALVKQGRTADALAQFAEAARLGAPSADLEHQMALALAAGGDLNGAVAHYQAALRLKPAFAAARNDLGFALMALGRTDEAMTQYTEALRLDPTLASAHTNAGFILASTGRVAEAIAHFQEAVRLTPDSDTAHSYLALALAGTGRTAEAAREFREVLRINPSNDGAKRGLAALGQGK